ncbi:hypothetical protein DSUL_10002 [Desulfovibrionales bacterium]
MYCGEVVIWAGLVYLKDLAERDASAIDCIIETTPWRHCHHQRSWVP